ncbi:MAG TPA: carboxypeptidase regulatory-like domain-containing protein [Bryobacteraceae bacterium]|nr:carboxypeptidase regulatory-like domain-containing protein [Bryobacteraceae bacterium]
MCRSVAKCLLSAAAVLLLFAGSAFGQMGAIQGKVVGEDGKPVQNAVIKIFRNDIKGKYQTKTNRRGEFFHAGLPAGRSTNYTVTLEIGGQDVDTVQNIVVPLGDPAPVNFDLAEKKRQAEALASGNLTAEQTRGMSGEQKEQLEKAMKERTAQLAKNKALSDAFNQGMEAMKVQQYQAAVDAFTKASELDPKQNAVWGQLAEACSSLAQQKTGAEQEALLAKSIEAFQKAMELKPGDAAYHNNYGLVLVRAKRISEAQAELEKAAQLDPANAGKYYYNMGAVMMNTGQMDAAGEAFKRAIATTPNYAPAWYQYGLYLLGKAQIAPDGKIQPPAGTREAFDAFLKLEPTGANADQARGILASFDQAIETKYTNPDAKKKAAPKK